MRELDKFDEPIFVTKPKMPSRELFDSYVDQIWENQQLTNNGPLHEDFRKKLMNFLQTDHIELTVNGHQALELAIKALDLKGEIITTPFTFASTTLAIINNGIKPVFCDVHPQNFTLDVEKIEKLITPKTTGIIGVHVFSNPCDVLVIETIAKKHNLKVIYDAAHAFGVKIDGKSVAEYGDISMFSLHATKVFNSIEGGVLAFNESSLVEKLNALKNFGLVHKEQVTYKGNNSKMNEFQAAMGLSNLKTIEQDLYQRRLFYNEYNRLLSKINFIELMEQYDEVLYNGSYFPILLPDLEFRDFIFEALKKYNVFTRKYFYPLTNQFGFLEDQSANTPIAKSISERVLVLPMYTDLSIHVIKKITEIIIFEGGIYLEKQI